MPSRNLEAVLVPHDIILGDIEANIEAIGRRIEAIDGEVDLIVLPELCFTGYFFDEEALRRIAETNSGASMQAVRRWSRERNAAVCGGFLAKDSEGRLFNRGFMMLPDGKEYFYDKHHLFCSGGESKIFTHGREAAPVIEYRTWRLTLAICYDIRFPVWTRNVGLAYDALIVPANWPHSRYHAWSHLLIARAIENQAYVLACDREGEDEYGKYERGDSMIIDHWGKIISRVSDDGTIYGTLRADDINRARERFSPWRDADEFTLSN